MYFLIYLEPQKTQNSQKLVVGVICLLGSWLIVFFLLPAKKGLFGPIKKTQKRPFGPIKKTKRIFACYGWAPCLIFFKATIKTYSVSEHLGKKPYSLNSSILRAIQGNRPHQKRSFADFVYRQRIMPNICIDRHNQNYSILIRQ